MRVRARAAVAALTLAGSVVGGWSGAAPAGDATATPLPAPARAPERPCPAGGLRGSTARAPLADGVLEVLVLGDSILHAGAAHAERRAQRAPRRVRVTVRTLPGSGLINGFDWLSEMERLVDEVDPDVVVAGFGGNYLPPYLRNLDGTEVHPGSVVYYQAWATAADRAMAALTARGAQVYWVLGPPVRDPALGRMRHGIDGVYLALASAWPGVRFVDGYAALGGPGGTYADALPAPGGGPPEKVRDDDGTHLTDAGARRLVDAATAAVDSDVRRRTCGGPAGPAPAAHYA